MPIPTLSVAPTAPDSSDRDTFDARGDAFLAYLETTFNTELNATIAAINAVANSFGLGLLGSSVTSHSIVAPAAAVAMTWTAGLNYLPGALALVARTSDPSKYMVVRVTAYNSGTGVMTGVCLMSSGAAGPYVDWSVSPSFYGSPTVLSATGSLVWTAIASLANQTKTIALPGALTTDSVHVSPDGTLGAGAVFVQAWVSAADVISVVVANITAGNITPNTRTWKATIVRP